MIAEETGKLLAHGTSTCLIVSANGHANGKAPVTA